MNFRNILFAFLVLSLSVSFSQEMEFKNFKLSEKVSLNDDVYVEPGASEVRLINRLSIEYIFEDEGLVQYQLIHSRVKLINDKGIERNNKVYLSLGASNELVNYQARVISKSNKVIELGKEALKEGVDEEHGYKYNFFAFEGIEIGDEIEYFYTLRKNPANYTGSRWTAQGEAPRYNVTFELICPPNLKFAFKTFNGLPEALEKDTTIENKNRWSLSLDSVPSFVKQEIAFEGANMKYLLYKLDKNIYTGATDIVNYSYISKIIHERYFVEKDKSEKKVVGKILKELSVDTKLEKEALIRAVENAVKKKYTFYDLSRAELEDLSYIYENKVFNKFGAIQLMCKIFTRLEIPIQIVMTSDRTYNPLDEEFEAYLYLNDVFIYFEELDLYMDASNPLLRLGYIGSEFMNTYGLFVKEVAVADYKAGVGEIRKINALGDKSTQSNIYVDAKFDDSFEGKYHVKHESSGYYANQFQCVFDLVKEERQKEEITESFLTYFIDEEGEFENVKATNAGGEFFGVDMFSVEGDLQSEKYIENAGKNRLFNVGLLIGAQVEMYQEGERVQPVQIDFNRSYHREISFNIPEGYELMNLDDSKINETFEEDGDTTMAFVSSYEKNGDKVKITVDEYYKRLELPKELFLDYQRVINAAANFNKVVLIFQKK